MVSPPQSESPGLMLPYGVSVLWRTGAHVRLQVGVFPFGSMNLCDQRSCVHVSENTQRCVSSHAIRACTLSVRVREVVLACPCVSKNEQCMRMWVSPQVCEDV